LILEDGCMEAVRDLAREEGRQLSQVVNDLLLEGIRGKRQRGRARVKLAAFSMGRPRVNLGNRHALEVLMDS